MCGMPVAPSLTTTITMSNVYNQFVIKRPKPSRRITGFEIIWKPMCLSLMKYSGALPTGKYNFIMTPHSDSGNNYKIRAIETPQYLEDSQLPSFGTTATDVKFSVDSIRFYAATVEGARVEDMTYYVDLENTRLLTTPLITTTSLSKSYFQVSPLTYALSVGFQDNDAGVDVRHSASRFKVGPSVLTAATATLPAVLLPDPELSLTRMFIQYTGKSFPQPDADPQFKTSANPVDYTTQRYIETQINSGAYFSEGGGESIQEYQRRGAYHYFSCPKDGQNSDTRVSVNTQFSADFGNKARILLWDHFSSFCKVTVESGQVVSVEIVDE